MVDDVNDNNYKRAEGGGKNRRCSTDFDLYNLEKVNYINNDLHYYLLFDSINVTCMD